jgi:hypothetical protein
MKPSLLLLAAVSILAAVAASSRASSATLSRSSCRLASLPPASAAGEQTLYGHVRSLVRKGRRFELRFDPAWLLTGVTATRASLEDTGSSDVPNDTYTRDESHRLLTFLVPPTARVTVLARGTCSARTTVAKLAASRSRVTFWIRVRGDTVRSIDQPYHP